MNDTNRQSAASFCVNTDGQTVDTRLGNISAMSAVPELFTRDSDIAAATALFCAAISSGPLVVERQGHSRSVEDEGISSRQQRDVTTRTWAGLGESDVVAPKRRRDLMADPIQSRSVNAIDDVNEQIRKFFR